MKILSFAVLFSFGLVGQANALDYQIVAPPSWTAEEGDAEPNVEVDAWFTEQGATIVEGVFIGPLLPGEIRRVNADAFLGSGRTICINAHAQRVGEVPSRVQAVPACSTFPRFLILPPTLLAP